MTQPRKPRKPKHGIALEVRRAQVQKSMDEIAREEPLLYKQLLYRLENGHKDPNTLTYEQTTALAKALDWTLGELVEALGIATGQEGFAPQDLGLPAQVLSLPVVNAGAGLPQWNDEAEMVSIVVPETKGKEAGDLFCVRVVGESMIGYASPGDLVVFEKSSVAEPGQVVAVHIPDDGLIVKRYYGVEKGALVLGNENRSIEPRSFEAPEGSVIYGCAIGRWQPG